MAQEMEESTVIIAGAGTSGLATAACLTRLSIPYILLEREDCYASIWKKKAYDRLHLHLPKKFCELPHMKFPNNYPEYVPKDDFVHYLDNYVAHFGISPLCLRRVVSAKFDENEKKWRVIAERVAINEGEVEEREEFIGRFLVVATGETSDPYCPEIEGLSSFQGKTMHSTQYKSGKEYEDRRVLVVGAGNSGFEIALDLANHGAHTSIVVRSPVHIISKTIMKIGGVLLKYLSFDMVDNLMVMFSKLVYGDLTKYGLSRPDKGPFYMKLVHGKYPIIDLGTYSKIKSGEIQVLPAITSINDNNVLFQDGRSCTIDAIIFATGFRRSTLKWLQGWETFLNADGFANPKCPNYWKAGNGLYSAGLARRGLYGAAMEAENIAQDIKTIV